MKNIGGEMRIVYTDHARLRMAMRGVTEAEVRETVESPDAVLPGEAGVEEIAVRHCGNRDVRVVYEEVEADHIVVITVMKPKVRREEQEN